jgi:pimeloyl-ACP methyl ester carboxylesterase
MTGTIINIITVLIGGALGLLFGARLPERLKSTVIAGMGLFTAAIGIQMFLKTQNPLIVLGALLIGALLGEWWQIEDGLQNLGRALEERFTPGPSTALRTSPSTALRTSPETAPCLRGFSFNEFRARLPDRLPALLRRPDDHPRLHPGRPDRQL